MKKVIIVAGKNKGDVYCLRRCLREKDYDSIPCKSAEQIIEETEILLTCNVTVSLVVIEPEILKDIGDDLIARLRDFALDVPFLLCNEESVQSDLADIFSKICEYRIIFKQEQNPELADLLRVSGVEVCAF